MVLRKKHFPVQNKKSNKTYFCFAYPSDLDQAYAFYCARYKDMSFKEFLELGITDFMKKLASIPENEPLYTIIKSRTIDLSKIKDKDERKYWGNLKRIHAIPSEYLPIEEIMQDLNKMIKEKKI